MTSKERRSATRTGIALAVELEVVGQPIAHDEVSGDPIERVAYAGQRGEKIRGQILDISINGARVGSDRYPAVLTRVAVRFDLPQYGEVEGVGLVMWRRVVPHEYTKNGQLFIREAGFGIVFESLSLEARTAIARLVARDAAG